MRDFSLKSDWIHYIYIHTLYFPPQCSFTATLNFCGYSKCLSVLRSDIPSDVLQNIGICSMQTTEVVKTNLPVFQSIV